MMGSFIVLFFVFLGLVGWTGTSLALTGAVGALILFIIVCLESLTLVQWFVEDESI